jgi:hypothetical protein
MSDVVHVVSCQVLESAVQMVLEGITIASRRCMEYGLHSIPQQMAPKLQAVVDAIDDPGIVLIGYGLCGNGLVGLESRGHTLIIPRVDDCIATLMGSYYTYVADFRAHPGTYYLSQGWLESGYHPVEQYRLWSTQYGEARARRIIGQMYQNYRRVALVAFTPAEMERLRPQAQSVAKFLSVLYAEVLGSAALLRRWIERAQRPGETDDEFVVVPPGYAVRQQMFIRR